MPRVRANGIDIQVETTGDPGDPAVLLIMGLGFQLIEVGKVVVSHEI